nr:reverse transcriptase domain-containing protein [Tanacetum cinerariifolium]
MDRHVLDRLGHRRRSSFDRLSETYSRSTTKSRPQETDSRDPSRGRSRAHALNASRDDRPKNRERFRSAKDRAAREWFDKLPPESVDGYKDLKAVFLAYFMQQKKYVKDPVKIHNIKQRDGETIEDFMKRFKTKTRRMKGAHEYMRISGFMHGVNNPELTKRLNEHVPKTMEEMMITTTAFIRGEAAAASKKKGHGHSREGRGSNRFTPLTRTLKEILEAEASKFQPPPPMVTPVEKKSNETGKKETAVKDKPTTIYMVQSWQRTVKQKVTQSFERVKEIAFPPLAASNKMEGPLVIEAEMGGHMIHRMYIDGGSSMEILYEHCFNRLRPEIKSQMVPATTSLTGFSGETIWPLGKLRLLVIIGDAAHSTKAWMNFMIVKLLSTYNVEGEIVTICNTILIPTECTSVITSSVIPNEERTRLANFKVALHLDFPDQEVAIVGTLSDKGRTELCSILKNNLDIFVWQVSDMTGVPRSVAEHRLNIREGYSSVRQKKKGQAPELAKAIQLAEADKEKTTFHTGQGVYCYTKMPFGLKNAGATYQRLMDKAFEGQIGRNIEVYVDDLVVKSYTDAEMIRDIEETFHTLRKAKNVDGSSCVDGSGLRLILTSPEGVEFTYALRFQFTASNNEAEYEALVAGLQIAARMGVKNVQVSVDSKRVANQVLGTYVAKEDNMVKYLEIVKSLVSGFITFSISQVPRSKNKKADALSKIVSTSFAHLSKQVLVEVLENKSIKEKEIATVIEEDGPTWMTQLVDYLKGGVLHGDKKEARKLRLKARQYELMEGVLYRRSFFTPWLKCVGPFQAEYVMRKIHEGSCSMHVGPRSVVAKAIWLGYYWQTMHKDARDMIRKCSDCPFLEGPGKVKFLIVSMDYFTKWIEAKAVATLTSGQVKKFIWDNIVCHFGIPGEIISDNGKQFSDNPFKDWWEGNKNWVKELPHVLWAHRTMIKSSHGDTPFSLTYGTEAVIPTEIGMPTYRTAAVDVVNNNEELCLNLDLLEERRERAAICEAKAKSNMTKYYNARVRGIAFKPGDFVYRSNDASHAVAGGKLGPKWEGPYEVTEALGNGAYKLRSIDGTILPRTWNIANLKRCYL